MGRRRGRIPDPGRRPRRLLALVESAAHVRCRTRVETYRQRLNEAGWQPDLVPAAWVGVRLLRYRAQLAATDAVLLQRRLLSAWQAVLLRRWARTIVLDLDLGHGGILVGDAMGPADALVRLGDLLNEMVPLEGVS